MIIYKCRVSGDEMFSDIYKIITTDDGLLEVEGKIITRKLGEIDDSLIGGNASAEEVCEGTDSASESGPDIVLNHKLCPTPCFDKKGFLTYLKAYVKALKAKIEEEHPDCPDKLKDFQDEAQKAGKKMMNLVTTKKDLEFFTGESMNADGIIGFLDYRDDGVTPYMTYMKCGLELEKC